MIIGDITNPFYAESSKIIMKKANEQAYDIIIGYTDYQDTNLEKAIHTMIGKRVDGILIATTERTNKKIPDLHTSGFPTVLYNAHIDDQEHSNFVIVNNEKGAYMAMEHLIQLGHTEIAFISGPQSFLNLFNRHTGYIKALSEYKIPYDKSIVYQENMVTLALKNLLMMIEEQNDEQHLQIIIDPILKIRKTTGPVKIKNE